MGVYADRVLPRLIHTSCGSATLQPLRRQVCAGLAGHVVEIGFGSGLNMPFLPAAVTRVLAVEPSDLAWELAGTRVAASAIPVERTGLDAQALPLADGSVDGALSTWTLCTVPDPGAALRELRRVLRPGGTLHFVEHGLAPDESVRRWQHRLDRVQQWYAGGCQLTRPIADLIEGSGFTLEAVDVFYGQGVGRIGGAFTRGVAR